MSDLTNKATPGESGRQPELDSEISVTDLNESAGAWLLQATEYSFDHPDEPPRFVNVKLKTANGEAEAAIMRVFDDQAGLEVHMVATPSPDGSVQWTHVISGAVAADASPLPFSRLFPDDPESVFGWVAVGTHDEVEKLTLNHPPERVGKEEILEAISNVLEEGIMVPVLPHSVNFVTRVIAESEAYNP